MTGDEAEEELYTNPYFLSTCSSLSEGIVIATLYIWYYNFLARGSGRRGSDIADDPTRDSLPGSVKINEEWKLGNWDEIWGCQSSCPGFTYPRYSHYTYKADVHGQMRGAWTGAVGAWNKGGAQNDGSSSARTKSRSTTEINKIWTPHPYQSRPQYQNEQLQ